MSTVDDLRPLEQLTHDVPTRIPSALYDPTRHPALTGPPPTYQHWFTCHLRYLSCDSTPLRMAVRSSIL